MNIDDRNFNMPYPIYPPYQGMNQMPNMGMPNQYPNFNQGNMNYSPNLNESSDQISMLEQKICNLDKRVTALEKSCSNENGYSSSNFQMM